jgi:DNA-binding CsgD family transcriptional regulator
MTVVILSVFAGINLAFAFLSFYIFLKDKKQKVYLYFCIFSLFSGLYFLLIASTGLFHNDYRWAILSCAAIYYGIFPWFIFSYINKKNNFILWILTTIFAVAIITFLIKPGENNYALWQIIAHIGLLGLMTITLYGSMVLTKEKKRSALDFLVLTIFFVFLGLEEIISNYSGVSFLSRIIVGIMPLDIYPLFFTLIIGKRLGNDVFAKKRFKLQLIENELTEKKLLLEEIERKRLQAQLQNKSKDLTDFGIEITRKKVFTQKLYDKLIDFKNASDQDSKELNALLSYVKSNLKIDNELELLQKNIDSVNHEFTSKLKEAYPSLTANELHLSSLLRLNFNTKEIATIKNISPDSVKVLRYRLRKKLNMPSNKGLSEFMRNFD